MLYAREVMSPANRFPASCLASSFPLATIEGPLIHSGPWVFSKADESG